MIARDILRFEVDFSDPLVVSGCQTIENFCQPHPRSPIDPPHDTKINRDNRTVIFDEQITLVHIRMEIAAADCLRQEGEHQSIGDLSHVMTFGLKFINLADLDSIDPFNRHHPAIGAIPVDFRDTVSRKPLHLFGQFRRRGRFAAKVKLAVRPTLEVGNRQLRT